MGLRGVHASASEAAGVGFGRPGEPDGAGLTAASVLAFLHHRRVMPLMERPLCIFQMTEEADPVALGRSRMLPTPLGRPYALTRARSAVDTRMLADPGRTPWDIEMLPTGPLVSSILDSVLWCHLYLLTRLCRSCMQLVSFTAAKSVPPTPDSRALGRAA
jgi:hypothetical protein